jgi:hypothetical protein
MSVRLGPVAPEMICTCMAQKARKQLLKPWRAMIRLNFREL